MNLYLISQNEFSGYDMFDSAVVCAESEESARKIHPYEGRSWIDPSTVWDDSCGSWCSSPDKVTAVLIGIASEGMEKGVVLASFNAG